MNFHARYGQIEVSGGKMDFFDAVKARRSVRVFNDQPVPEEVIQKALDAALLAPNSSNMQTWGFYRVSSPEKKAALVEACMGQSAARTAPELIVITAERRNWKRNQGEMLRLLRENQGPKFAFDYYGKLIPLMYGFTWLAPLKWALFNTVGIFRPMARRPWSAGGIDEVCIKSAALASENFMLAIAAQGYGTCPMEGFDERRVKRILGLKMTDRVVMVISAGLPNPEKGVWGPQVRFTREWFVRNI
jgi:nitroreductase